MRMPEHSHIGARDVRPMVFSTEAERAAIARNYSALQRIGIGLDSRDVNRMAYYLAGVGMDADLVAPNATQASITTPVQFLQSWLPGFVHDVTDARVIDELVGITTQGAWHDEEIVQGLLERTGRAIPYGDYTNIPQASWNVNYVRRTIVRFEQGMTVGRLEEARAAAIRMNSAEGKRGAAARALDIERNLIGFFGFNSGANRTYGFLNETGLPAYVTVAAGVGGSTWALKTYLEIVNDILTALAALRTQSGDRIDVKRTPITLALPTNAIDFLSRTTDFGETVHEWLQKNYPNVRYLSAPELDDANGGSGVFYLYADTVNDSGTDDNRTWVQVVPNRFQTLGVDQRAKDYEEDYSNATAGLMLKRPYAIVRYTGIS